MAMLKAAFNKASDLGWSGPNPAVGIRRFKEHSRDRFLQPDEMESFFRALLAEPNKTLRDFFLVALLTGQRRADIQSMAWADINLDLGLWRIPDGKGGEPVVVPLVQPALRILETRQEASGDCRWVFPGRGKTGHIVEPKAAWRRILDRAGLEDLRIHDLRRSLGSWLTMGGASLPITGKALGHRSQASTNVYARLDVASVRGAVGKATDAMLAAGGVHLLESGGTEGDEQGL
jgi:integrase